MPAKVLKQLGGTTDVSVAAEDSSQSGPFEAVAAFRVDGFDFISLADPAGADEQGVVDACTAKSEAVAPAAVKNKALSHYKFKYISLLLFAPLISTTNLNKS